MIRLRLLHLTLFLALAILLGLLTLRFSPWNILSRASSTVDQEITLILPDQEYIVLAHTLDFTQVELVIPTQDPSSYRVNYHPDTGTVTAVSPPVDYVVDMSELSAALAPLAGQSQVTLTPPLTRRERYAAPIAHFNHQLNRVYRAPLTVNLKDGTVFSDFVLGPNLIRSLILPQTTDLTADLEVDRDLLLSHITPSLTGKQREYFKPEIAYTNVKAALNARFHDDATPTVLGVDDGPTTGGEQADRYLEVDLSQQKMYFFIGGSLYKSYRISTGIDYPTPVGEYHILNKAPKAFSEIYNVWMPYWMGFKYAGEVGAYLGIHEIAYTVDERGKPYYRHGYYIGDKMTGGCVAMEPSDAPEIYNLSHEGMLIRIVP